MVYSFGRTTQSPAYGYADTNPFKYGGSVGYYTESNTSCPLVLCTHRWYYPAMGRWINRDPIEYNGGLNLYGYCGDRPVGRLDRRGLQAGRNNNDYDSNPYNFDYYWNSWTNAFFPTYTPRGFDYYQLTLGFNILPQVGGSWSGAWDSNGHFHYLGISPCVGTEGFSASLTGNWINDNLGDIEDFLSQPNVNVIGGFGAVGSVTVTGSGRTSTGVGVGNRQAGSGASGDFDYQWEYPGEAFH